jgi:hypothetical protein
MATAERARGITRTDDDGKHGLEPNLPDLAMRTR